MSGFQNSEEQNLGRPSGLCIGRMINIFDLSAGLSGSKMLTEKAHRDVSPVHRNKQDINKPAPTSRTNIDGKQIDNDTRKNSSTKKYGGTPVKMLIAKEMSKETDSMRKPPSIVARLMGLDDDLTAQPNLASTQKKFLEDLPRTSSSVVHRDYHQRAVSYQAVPRKIHQQDDWKMEHRDVNQPPQKARGRFKENQDELRMAFVRQKFMEAKRLATDEKLLQSKEFQDALEVLSSNRDLFLKFLEEPNSLFKKQLSNLHPVSSSPQTKCITVLRPSNNADTKFEKMVNKYGYPDVAESGWRTNNRHRNSQFNHLNVESFSQPTRIVVLKPSTGKTTNVPTLSPKQLLHCKLYDDPIDSEASHLGNKLNKRSKMMQKSTAHRRDESLLSSMFSNVYGGDGSSFNQSEINYNEESVHGFSDSEIETATPTSRHSWDKFGSPYSVSSFSQISYSPESSVNREAKKRLSERCALMISNSASEEQLNFPRSTSTLGEMLAIPEVKRDECVNRYTVPSSRSYGGEDELRSHRTTNTGLSPGNLSRSKSVPVSSSAFNDINLKIEGSDTQVRKNRSSEVSKAKHGKFSLRGKVSIFLFSRNKKYNGERLVSPTLAGSKSADKVVTRANEMQTPVWYNSELDRRVNDGERFLDRDFPISITDVPKQVTQTLLQSSRFGEYIEQEKLIPHQKYNNLNQPSPTSILDAPFEDDISENLCRSSETNAGEKALSRASPIESVARTLSWDDDTHLEMSPFEPLNLYRSSSKAEDISQEYFLFVQKLLSYAGLEKSNMMFSGWHSLESPLDPVLLNEFLDWKDEKSKHTEKGSYLRLLFDCVNSALIELSWSTLVSICPLNRASCGTHMKSCTSSSFAEDVWGLARDWFSGNRTLAVDGGSKEVDGALRKEVGGNKWDELAMTELEEITKELSGEVLKDLVQEAFTDFAAACLVPMSS